MCPRQCALIHLERAWLDNQATAEGKVMHERVDRGGAETRGGLRQAWGLPLRSARLGVVGKADLVEFRRDADGGETAFPVEHKRGREKEDDRDRVQLCAQALCLEEMTGRPVPAGALFYHATRRRLAVAFDAALRRRTEDAAAAVRMMLAGEVTPPPVKVSACGGCSLADICLPDAVSSHRSRVDDYFQRELARP